MAENLSEAGSIFRHSSRATLAESDSVPLTTPIQNDFSVFYPHVEVVAGDSIPAKSPAEREASGFAFAE